jgi:putative CocE/NonD family hydrolase
MNTTTVQQEQRQRIAEEYGSLGPHQVELTTSVTITVDDGLQLAGVLAFPKGLDRVPVVLMRTPYDPSSFPAEVAAFYMGEVIVWASHGYACLLQTTRTTTSYFHEAADGAATVRWIEQQPWFDGHLGLNGGSYHAFTAWATASSRPTSLKAISTAAYSADRVSSWYPGGSFALELALSWTARQQASGADVGEDPYDHLPLTEADAVATGGTLDFYQERLVHDGTDPHWHPLDFTRLLDAPPAPILHIDGWYDYHRTYFWHDFERLNRNNSDIPHRFVIGPWPHAALDPRIAMAEKLAWFDKYLRGNGGDRPRVLRYYRTGVETQWSEIERWREPDTIVFYAGPDGQLRTERTDDDELVEWTYDPADPTPSIKLATLGTGDVGGLWDSSRLEQRPDVQVFTTGPVLEPMDLAGRVSAVATFYSDAPSADLYLRLLDVFDTGEVQSVADGILRVTDCALRDGVAVDIDLGPVGHRLAPGHRLRLLAASGAHPYYNRNLGNGEPTATATHTRVAYQAVAVGGDNGMRITLPLAD